MFGVYVFALSCKDIPAHPTCRSHAEHLHHDPPERQLYKLERYAAGTLGLTGQPRPVQHNNRGSVVTLATQPLPSRFTPNVKVEHSSVTCGRLLKMPKPSWGDSCQPIPYRTTVLG